jgi:hypothetical protein
MALRNDVKLIGWLPIAGGGLAVAILLALNAPIWPATNNALLPVTRIAEVTVPLAVGLQAAFLLSPEDEEPLELLLSYPRPLSRTLLERLLVMAVLQSGVAMGSALLGRALGATERFVLASARWIAPAGFIGGAALYATIATRKGALGALTGTILWGGMLVGGRALLVRWPWLWPLHVYLQPSDVPLTRYAVNRIVLTLTGSTLVWLATRLTRDEEHMLGMAKMRRRE